MLHVRNWESLFEGQLIVKLKLIVRGVWQKQFYDEIKEEKQNVEGKFAFFTAFFDLINYFYREFSRLIQSCVLCTQG